MQGTLHRNRERGIALLAVVAVLVLLAIIATPFLVTMRDGAERGKAVLASSEAAQEAENVFRVATAFLGSSDDSVERNAAELKLTGQAVTPDWDTPDEFQIPPALLAASGFDPETGRIWGVGVEDESAKVNVNSAPFTLLGGFFGISELAEPLDQDATEAVLRSDGGLPVKEGVVRLGDEVVKYQSREGTTLRGLQRGFLPDRPGNGPARKHDSGEIVVNEVAFQIAAYPILARRGKVNGVDRTEYAPYGNLYELRRISDLGVAALSADDWERVVDHLTVNSRGVTGLTFADAQNLREPVKAGQDGHRSALKLENPYRFGIGTVVRVSDGTNTDYGVVYGIGGGAYVNIVPSLQHDYDANTTTVESMVRHPVNVNTASEAVLTAIHAGIRCFGKTAVATDTAKVLAERVVKERANPERPGIRGLRDYSAILDKLVDEGGITPEDRDACQMNALNPLDSATNRLAVGSVPVAFRSCGVFTVTARAVVLDRSGREVGRREFRRLVDVSPQGPAVYEIQGQAELDEIVRVTSAKFFTTSPVNVSWYDNLVTGPSSRFSAFFRQDRWPSTDRNDTQAGLRYVPSRNDFGTGSDTLPEPLHFDSTEYTEGNYLKDAELTIGINDSRVAMKGDSGLEAFSAALWFKPYWGGRQTAYILDNGKAEWEDRVALFYDGDRRELVFRVKDTSLQKVASEVRYPFDASTWEDDTWYHLMVTATGSEPGQMSLFVDGVKRGKPTLLTWTTQAVDGTGTLQTLAVEDASSFPEKGALLLRGPDGVEVLHYDGKTAGGFSILGRFARMNRADTVDDANATTTRSFPEGTAVVLYGYSIPTTSRIPEGSGTLAADLGRLNVLLLSSASPPDAWPNSQGSGGGTTTGGGGGGGGLPALVRGWRGDTITLNLGQDVTGWDGRTGSEAAQAFGQKGYAILASGDGNFALTFVGDTTNERLFDAELVSYEVNGGNLVIKRKPEPTAYLASSGGASSATTATAGGGTGSGSTNALDKKGAGQNLAFVPQHSYGNVTDSGLKLFFQGLKQQNINNGRVYADEQRITEDGIISFLVPLSVEVAEADRENFLDPDADRTRTPETCYFQIGKDDTTEWVRYDAIEKQSTVTSNLLFVRDRSARRMLALFRHFDQGARSLNDPSAPSPTPTPTPTPDPGGGGGGGGGDQPPIPPPTDGGGGGSPDQPPSPPDDGGGGDDDAPGGTPDMPPVPPDPGPGGDNDGPGGDPDQPPEPGPDGGGDDDGPGGDPDTPPEPGGGGEDDGGGGAPDVPPDGGGGGGDTGGGTTPPDTGGTPDGGDTSDPADPTTGGTTGGTAGTTGGSGSAKVPFPIHEMARYLDFRSTIEDNTADTFRSVWVGDLTNKVLEDFPAHRSGAQVLPCFLVAFPGIEYDPQGNGSVVEEDLDAILTAQSTSATTGGTAPTTGGSSTGGSSSAPAGQVTGTGGGSTSSSGQQGKVGDTGDKVDPGSQDVLGPYVEPGPGEDDVVTVVAPGDDGAREEHTVNWSHRKMDWNRGRTVRRSWTWVAFKEPVEQEYSWSSGAFGGGTYEDMSSQGERFLLGQLADRRSLVRLVKSPSGELPSRVDDTIHVGAAFDGGGFAQAMVDEVRFATPRNTNLANHRRYVLGLPAEAGGKGANLSAEETNIPIHLFPGHAVVQAAEGIRTSGGLLRIGDEIVAYSDFDESDQTFTGCRRGFLGSEARQHSYGEPVTPVFGMGVARLEEAITETSSRLVLANYRGFPLWGGFVRVGDEIIGYTRIDQNVLQMPEGRQIRKDGTFDPYADTNAGAGLFRGRFGSGASSHDAGELVVHLDHRYPDLVREKADDPMLACFQVCREVKGAMWKRVSWDQKLRSLEGIRVQVRFEGGPPWDSDKVIRLDTDGVPEKDRNRWIYEMTDPLKLNLLDVQSDRIECRVYFTYEQGAWNPAMSPAPDAWKDTPWLQAFRIEYVAPSGVLTTEDLR